MKQFETRKFVLACTVTLAATIPTASAAIRTWTGAAGDWDYGNSANWSTTLPANNDHGDDAVFSTGGTPGTVSLITSYSGDTSVSHRSLQFTTAGWSLDVNYENLRYINSAGTGTNSILKQVQAFADGTWTVASGNTLFLDGGFYERNKVITLVGGGVLRVDSAIGGFGSGTWGIHITDNSTLQVDATSPYAGASSGKAYIGDPTGKLVLRTNVAGATSLIGSRIIDETGLGLEVTDIGGGYVRVSAIPEPASLALIGGLALSCVRRRRA
jgi:hypothetical protein